MLWRPAAPQAVSRTVLGSPGAAAQLCCAVWFTQVTHDISHLTCADFLRAPGVQTPVIVRFSTVVRTLDLSASCSPFQLGLLLVLLV